MTTNPSLRNATFPDARHGLDVTAVLFGIVIVFLAQGVLGRVVQRAQQGLLPPGPVTHTLAGSALMLPTLQVAVCTLFLIPWTLLGDRYGPRLPYTGGLLVWALGGLAGSWAGSTEFLLASYALQAAGVAAVIPATLTVITSAQPRPGGFLTGVVVAFPALLQLPGSLIADLLTRSTDWRAALLLVSGAAVPPLLLGWFAIPSGPATTGPDDDPPPERPAGRWPRPCCSAPHWQGSGFTWNCPSPRITARSSWVTPPGTREPTAAWSTSPSPRGWPSVSSREPRSPGVTGKPCWRG